MKYLLLLSPAFIITSLCIAQPKADWVLAATTQTGGKVYINPSVVKRSGEILAIEYTEENRLLDSLANIHSSTITIVDIKCASKQMRLAGMRMYDAKGKLLMQHSYKDEPWDSGPANSVNQHIVMKACAMFRK
ncbi:MAG: surface-adhesin E family protein [Ginsengibacter sp.]